MKTQMRALALAAFCVVGWAGAAQAQTSGPEGDWIIESRDSRYQVSICGEGEALCAKLVWLGNGADTEKNRPYLNKLLLNQAAKTGDAKWDGTLELFGHKVSGTVSQMSADKLRIRGCFLGIFCRSYELYRWPEAKTQ